MKNVKPRPPFDGLQGEAHLFDKLRNKFSFGKPVMRGGETLQKKTTPEEVISRTTSLPVTCACKDAHV